MNKNIDDIFDYAKKMIKTKGKHDSDKRLWLDKQFLIDLCDRSVIYFLLDEKENIIYVGQSVNLMARLKTHLKEDIKDFNSFFWIFVKPEEIDFAEALFINLYDPKHNKHYPTIDNFHNSIYNQMGIVSRGSFQKTYGKDYQDRFIEWIENATDRNSKYKISMRKNK